MQLPSRYWADLTTRQFARLRDAPDIGAVVAVLPVGATEQHGPHLPLSVDSDLVDAVVGAALPLLSAELPVLVLPTQRIGKSNEHARFPGTLSLGAETLIRVWTDIGDAKLFHGIGGLGLRAAFKNHAGAHEGGERRARIVAPPAGEIGELRQRIAQARGTVIVIGKLALIEWRKGAGKNQRRSESRQRNRANQENPQPGVRR